MSKMEYNPNIALKTAPHMHLHPHLVTAFSKDFCYQKKVSLGKLGNSEHNLRYIEGSNLG